MANDYLMMGNDDSNILVHKAHENNCDVIDKALYMSEDHNGKTVWVLQDKTLTLKNPERYNSFSEEKIYQEWTQLSIRNDF